MSKFKVGDRVRTDGGNRGIIVNRFSDTLWDVLHDNSPRRPTSFQGWAYTEDELELIEDEPQPYDTPSPEADALDHIAYEVKGSINPHTTVMRIYEILRETGRL